MSARAGIDSLLYLMNEAFRGRGIEESNESQALLTNLATVSERAWRALPAGASSGNEKMALHVGACKIIYDDYSFGTGTLRFGTPEVEPWGPRGPGPKDDVLSWIEHAHQSLIDHVAALADDRELSRPRLTNWGELRPTRWIVAAIITHDAYHAGEINHVRSLLDGDDRWRYEQLGFG